MTHSDNWDDSERREDEGDGYSKRQTIPILDVVSIDPKTGNWTGRGKWRVYWIDRGVLKFYETRGVKGAQAIYERLVSREGKVAKVVRVPCR